MDAFSGDEIMCEEGIYLIHMRYDLGRLHFAILDEDMDAVRAELADTIATIDEPVGRLGKIATHYAALVGNVQILQFLHTNFASLSKRDNLGWTPLHDAVYMGRLEAIRWFLDQGVDVEERGRSNQTSLMLAASRGTVRVAMELLRRGAKLESKDDYGRTPLIRAGSSGVKNMISYLLKLGANPDVCDRVGRNVLHTAIKSDNLATVRYVLNKGICDVNQPDADGSTPLIRAVSRSNFEVVPLLLDNGASVEGKNKKGHTALSQAIRIGHAKTVRLLMQCGADPYSSDEDEISILRSAGNKDVKEILRTYIYGPKFY